MDPVDASGGDADAVQATRLSCACPEGAIDVDGALDLGLGLYVARLIAEFHGGSVRAENLSSGEDVVVSAAFRLA